jgi:amidophosphoribosyltransferase
MAFLREACGVFGIYDLKHGQVYPYVYWGLIAQNHRGHQSHGFLTYDGKQFHVIKNDGHATEPR